MGSSKARPVGTSYVPTLDGWRAVAILLVILSHWLSRTGYPRALELGFTGVLLFFAISGFLITSRIVEEDALSGAISFRKFYVRRFFRILPPAIFYLVVIALLGLLSIVPFSLVETLKALFFLRNYTPFDVSFPPTWYSGHFWSLSVEEHFYLLWPAIFVIAGIKRARWVAPSLAVATILWRQADDHFNFFSRFFDAATVRQAYRTDHLADVLLWGCTLALLLGVRPWNVRLPRGAANAGVVLIACFAVWSTYSPTYKHLARPVLFFAMTLLIGLTICDPTSWVGQLLEWAPLRFIGRLSYSLYLWQQLFFPDVPIFRLQGAPWNFVGLGACALLSYHLIERPFIHLGHRIARPAKLRHADDVTAKSPIFVKI
jgi:peptidoglycan/LPS O-acetylase OafA/YrhL